MDASTGRVVTVHGQHATVQVDAAAVCPRCAEGKGCGAGLFGQSERDKALDVLIPPELRLQEGDEVDVVLEPRGVLRAAGLVYGLPLITAVLMAAAGWWLGLSESGAVLMALAGLAAGLLFARKRLRSESCLREFTPTITPRT